MSKIVSRLNEEEVQIELLQDSLLQYSMGAIVPHGSAKKGVAEVADNLNDLISQASGVLAGQCLALDDLGVDLQALRLVNTQQEMQISQLESMLACVVDNIDYDEALDHASSDLMDAFQSSGAAEVNADGSLAFDERVTFNKEDIKPMLRAAIVRWIELRLSQ